MSSMAVMDEEEPQEVTGVRTRCHNCQGDGYIVKPCLTLVEGYAGTTGRPAPCPQCKGSSWLPGFVIPI